MNNKTTKPNKTKKWSKNSWRSFPVKQQPNYLDKESLSEAENYLSLQPSLVHPNEIENLKKSLGNVAQGKGFLLQGGDCAESFAEFSSLNLTNYFKVMLQMTVALMYGAGKPVVKVGRIAGQFAKPRSSDMEEENGISLPSYRGDMVNAIEFDAKNRIADPARLVQAYRQSLATINFLRSLATGGYSSLRNVQEWNLQFASTSKQGKLFSDLVGRINESLNFTEALGLKLENVNQLHQADFYTSHEALLLNYEEAFTLTHSNGKNYCCSAHMLWIGDRTRNIDEAHVEFMRGLANPIAVKSGPSMEPDNLLKLIDILNPQNEAGKLTVITRMGSENVEKFLPKLLAAVKSEGKNVIWSCDPMHGNTVKSPNGYKTRHFNKILAEVKNVFDIHKAEGTYAGGIHLEMTGQDVTECVGGAQAISELNLKDRYHTHCDPRLNASQSLELAFLIADELRNS